jgi:mRNA interferase RelE/StbE
VAYAVQIAPGAEREFSKLAREIQLRIRPRIDALANDPRPAGAMKLRGQEDLWRIRVGDYRVLYEVHDRILYVLLVRVAHRREVYR